MITLNGKCLEHGEWQRECSTEAQAELLKGRCPKCDDVVQPIKPALSFDLITIDGNCGNHGYWENRVLKSHVGKMQGRCPFCDAERMQAEQAQEVAERSGGPLSRRQRKINELLGGSGIPKRFRERTFLNYRAETPEQQLVLERAQRYAENFDKAMDRGASFIFNGLPGTGKTHLACAVANHAISRWGCSALFITVLEALQRIKATYGGGEKTEAEVIEMLASVDLLVLDEVGVQLGTKFEEVMITDIINRRYADMRPTIILSNLDSAGLESYLGARVLDRMGEGGGGVLAFNWPSYRPKVLKDKDLPSGGYKAPDWL